MPTVPHVIHILPFRSVQPDGVGDYAAQLAGAMRSGFGIGSSFVVANPDGSTALVADGFATFPMHSRDSAALVAAVRQAAASHHATTLVIHMAGYGYARTGAPFWLARAIGQLRRLHRDDVVVGVFHELFAGGPLFSRSYWTGMLQRQFCRRAARLCDHIVTTNDRYAGWMRGAHSGSPVIALPVFSTIGEAASEADTSRPRQLAIFARANAANAIYCDRRNDLRNIVEAVGATRIIDIGQRHVAPPPSLAGVPVQCLGRLDAADVAAQLQKCSHGVVDYGAMPLAKSTIFAAYAANGVVPICLMHDPASQDGLVPGQHFVPVSIVPPCADWTVGDENTMRKNIMAWYQPHALDQQAARFAEMVATRLQTPRHA